MFDIKNIGLAIQAYRWEEGYTQGGLSGLLSKDETSFLTRIENRQKAISLLALNEIAQMFEIRLSEIIQVAEEIEEVLLAEQEGE